MFIETETEWVLAIFALLITGFLLFDVFQPSIEVCETAIVMTLDKNIIDQKYAVELQQEEKITTIFTTPEKYATLQTGETVKVCYSKEKFIELHEPLVWLED